MHATSRRIATLTVFAVLTAACGGGSSVSPPGDSAGDVPAASTATSDSRGETGAPATLPEPAGGPATIDVTLDDKAATTATIDSSGGEISVEYREVAMTLRVPPGAVSRPIDITLTPVSDASSPVLDSWVGGVEFSPSGLLFAEPAVLELSGPAVTPDLTFVEWGQSGGEVVPSITRPGQDGRMELTVAHFSGAGAGEGSEGGGWQASSGARQVIRMIIRALAQNPDAGCVDTDNPAAITAASLYRTTAHDEIFPALEAAQQNDMVLLAATRSLLDWWSVPDTVRGFACDDLVSTLTDIRDSEGDTLGEWLRAGYVHAIFEAFRQCKLNRDPGEMRHMAQWHARALMLLAIPHMKEETWEDLTLQAVKACGVYRIEVHSQLELDLDPGRMRGTISATASDVPDAALADLLGFAGVDSSFSFSHGSRLELPSAEGCTYQDGTSIKTWQGLALNISAREPKRRIPDMDGPVADPSPGSPPPEPNTAETAAERNDGSGGTLRTYPLEGEGSVTAKCDDMTFRVPHVQDLIPMWFNFAVFGAKPYDDSGSLVEGVMLVFHLRAEYGTALVASYLDRHPLIDPTDPTAQVDQETEVKVFHTPGEMARKEPPPPQKPDWAG